MIRLLVEAGASLQTRNKVSEIFSFKNGNYKGTKKKQEGESVVDVAVNIPSRSGFFVNIASSVDLSSTRSLLEEMIFLGADESLLEK